MVSIAFTGGGTGGHIYPGLAVISSLKELISCRIFWIGSDSGMDRAIVEGAGIEFFGIPSGKLRRYFSFKNVSDIFRIMAGYFAARKILKREKAAFLFSKGGFVSVPPCAAASSLKIPVFSHESDYSPGLATRINARFSNKIFIPYRESIKFFKDKVKRKLSVSGNPIRPEFAGADPAKGRTFLGLGDNERILLILGGSLGSREINELTADSLLELTRHYTVVHQYGEANASDIAVCENHRYKPYAYFRDEIPHIIAAAEIVLCRSGAGTIWECKYLKKPMVLVPLRGSGTRGDQVENARLFEESGAAVSFIPDSEENNSGKSSREALCALIASLAEDPKRRKAMGDAEVAEREAAPFIADEILKIIKSNI